MHSDKHKHRTTMGKSVETKMRRKWHWNLDLLFSALRKQHGSSDSSGAAAGAKQTQQSAPINLATPRLQTYTRVSAPGIDKKSTFAAAAATAATAALAFQASSRRAGSILELCCKHGLKPADQDGISSMTTAPAGRKRRFLRSEFNEGPCEQTYRSQSWSSSHMSAVL